MEETCIETHDIIIDYSKVACTLGETEMSGMSCIEEFIENSISAEASKINIYIESLDRDCKVFNITVEDNGIGINKEILQTKVFSVGHSGLAYKNSLSIHGYGGIASLYVIQKNHQNWTLETLCEESLQNNLKYIVEGPIENNKKNGIKSILLKSDEKKMTGTRISATFDRSMFSKEFGSKNAFDWFVQRIHERLGIKYYKLLSDSRTLMIDLYWSHQGSPKQDRRGRSEGGYHPPASGHEPISAVDWRKLTVADEDLPIERAISDQTHSLTHIQYCTKILDRMTNDKARTLGIENHRIFPLKNHFQNTTDPKCFYIFYRGMLVENLRLSDIMGSGMNNRIFDYSRYISIIELDPNTDPKITNIIKNKGKRSHPQYEFLMNKLIETTPGDLRRVFPKSDLYERDLKKKLVDRFNSSYRESGSTDIAELEVSIPFGLLDIVITNEVLRRKNIWEVKRGKAEAKDFIQIKDYQDQIEIANLFDGYEITYTLVAETFAKAVVDRCNFFQSRFGVNLKRLIITENDIRIEPYEEN